MILTLEERIDAYRKAGILRGYVDQTKALTELRHSDAEFAAVPVSLQRATLKRLDEAYRGFFRRVIKACTFRRTVKGWFAGFVAQVPTPTRHDGERSVGIDLGITTFAALSDGSVIPSLRAARRAERRLRLAQRALARKRRGSKSRQKARVEVSRCHAAISRSRANHLLQASAHLLRRCQRRVHRR